jgi:hypothetical protein
MAARLPQISGTQRIAPTAVKGVSVSTESPALKVEAQGYGNLAERMAQLSNVAFKYAFTAAETKGLTYGALAAPTVNQIEAAKEAGKPITAADLVGDPGSISFYEQAARKGAVAVTEDRIESAGRRALTTAVLDAAANPNITPDDFGLTLDNIVKEYSESMELISPTSAAKVSASLALVANGQAVSFARSYATNQAKANKNLALSEVSPIIAGLKDLISGYVPESEVPLNDILETGITILESKLTNGGVGQTQINTAIAKARTQISEYKVAVISEWASTGENSDTPTLALARVNEGNLPPHIKSVWDSMDHVEKAAARKSVLSAAEASQRRIELGHRSQVLENEQAEINIYAAFNVAMRPGEGDPSQLPNLDADIRYEAAQQAIADMEVFDPEKAQEMRERLDANWGRPIVSERASMDRLGDLYANRTLTMEAINNATLSSDDYITWLERIPAQTDALMRDAETMLKGVIQPPATSLSVLTNVQVQARNQYNAAVHELFKLRRAAERDGEFFDPTEAVEIVMKGHLGGVLEEAREEMRNTIQAAVDLIRDRIPDIKIEVTDIDKIKEIYWEWEKVKTRRNERNKLKKAIEAWNQLNEDQAVQLER